MEGGGGVVGPSEGLEEDEGLWPGGVEGWPVGVEVELGLLEDAARRQIGHDVPQRINRHTCAFVAQSGDEHRHSLASIEPTQRANRRF